MEEEVVIQDVAFGGSGVGRLSNGKPIRPAQDLPGKKSEETRGKAVFVPRTLVGEKARVRTIRDHKGYVEAELIEILQASSQRVDPPCPYYNRCGGCAYQHATYGEQLRIKEKQFRDTLARIGGFRVLPSLHVEAAPQPFGYRNKIVLHRDEKGHFGYFGASNRNIVDIEKCLIASDSINEQLKAIRERGARPGPSHLALTDQSQREISNGGFHQVNTPMAGKILDWVRRETAENSPAPPGSRLLDLYCGAGFFALGLADLFSEICGMDRDPRAIHSATVRTGKMGMKQIRFFAGDVSEKIEWILETQLPSEGVVLVDPPREGLDRKVIESLLMAAGVNLVFYISCNPATLARDLKLFTGTGKFGILKLALFDMFPQTFHIEAGAVLSRI